MFKEDALTLELPAGVNSTLKKWLNVVSNQKCFIKLLKCKPHINKLNKYVI